MTRVSRRVAGQTKAWPTGHRGSEGYTRGMSRKPAPELDALPPIARAEAMDRPYRPGRARRQVLLGIIVVSSLLVLFLWLMPRSAPPARVASSPAATAAPPTPGVVYQNLHATPVAPPPRESDHGAAKTP